MKEFGRRITELFVDFLPFEVKLDMASMLACKKMEASCASILMYMGRQDRLVNRGRYIDPEIGQVEITGDGKLKVILENMYLYDFLYSRKDKFLENSCPKWYEEYKKDIIYRDQITEEKFLDLVKNQTTWLPEYEKYKQTLRKEAYDIEYAGITGRFFREKLKEPTEYNPDMRLEDLLDIPIEKQICKRILKEKLQMIFNSRYYVAIPLFANKRYFGVLRFQFPEREYFKKQQDGKLVISDDNIRENLQYLGQIISLHIENSYLLRGMKKTVDLLKINPGQQLDLENTLNNQCELLAQIIESKGALIRRRDEIDGNYNIVGFSDLIKDYIDYIQEEGQKFFKELSQRFQGTGVLAVQFNCNTRSRFTKYSGYDETGRLMEEEDSWDIDELGSIVDKLKKIGILNVAVLAIPGIQDSFIVFLNTPNRVFLSKDFALVYPALKNLGMDLRSIDYTRSIEKRMEVINRMHEEIRRLSIGDGKRTDHWYVKEFLEIIANTIKGLRVFSHYINWQYVSEVVPPEHIREGHHFFRNITPEASDNLPYKDNASNVYHRHSYYPLEIEEKKFNQQVLNYFKGEKLEPIINIPINEDYRYFDLPFYAERNPGKSNPTLVGLLTLVYPSHYATLVQDREFMKFMQFFSEQLSIAWDNLQEYIALKIQGSIDQQIKSDRKEGYRSRDQELHSISQILAEEFACHLCCFFLENPREKTLSLDSANIPIEHPITYDLQTDTQVLSVRSYNSNLNFRIFGRQRVEQLADSQKIMIIEEEARKAGIMHDPIIENWLSVLIAIGSEKLGLIKLFRLKSRERPGYKSPPFSEFETNLLNRIQKHIFNILITHHTIRQRMKEMNDFLHLVMSPLNALIARSTNLVDGIAPVEKIPEKHKIILSLSRTAAHYVRNYRRIFEMENRQSAPELDDIPDLKEYLADLALVYQPYIEKKYICIHVTEQTKENIKIRLDKELFELVILNLLDNAVKYSFSAEERVKIGLQAKPASIEDKENVLLTALESGNEIIITISSLGLGIPEDERSKIFKREFRGQKARMTVTGTGIGLYIAREIVQLHDGIIELVPTDHKNHTTFKITLPKNLGKEGK